MNSGIINNYTLGDIPSFAKILIPCSSYSALDIQNSSLSFIISARTAPPKKTMCFLLGGSSIRILNF